MTIESSQNESGPLKRKKVVLGRGIEALIPDIDPAQSDSSGEYFTCDVRLIRPNPFQPRIRFAQEELEELSRSILEQGILQPLMVRKAETGYEVIAGERRLRAARMAGMNEVPVVVKNVSDGQLLEISIIENIQREDLNPLEEAEAYNRLIDEFHLTQEEVAVRVGKSRPAIANFLRLRQLPEPIKASLMDGALTMGHARAILGADTPAQQQAAWKAVIAKGLSVRETEALVKRLMNLKPEDRNSPHKSFDVYLNSLANDLSQDFGTRVRIKRKGRKGRVEIEFYSDDDLDRLIGLLKRI
jgi:ParB family transcriptional regulator, chromosome partitioning protein